MIKDAAACASLTAAAAAGSVTIRITCPGITSEGASTGPAAAAARASAAAISGGAGGAGG